MHYALANLYAYSGEMDKAIEQWLQAYQIATAEMPAEMPDLEEAWASPTCTNRGWTMMSIAILQISAFSRRAHRCVIKKQQPRKRQLNISRNSWSEVRRPPTLNGS
jgi:hypothetical protein